MRQGRGESWDLSALRARARTYVYSGGWKVWPAFLLADFFIKTDSLLSMHYLAGHCSLAQRPQDYRFPHSRRLCADKRALCVTHAQRSALGVIPDGIINLIRKTRFDEVQDCPSTKMAAIREEVVNQCSSEDDAAVGVAEPLPRMK